jgi:D-glycero-alpha-D-manno-heptose-7-phosphate kinase
MDSPLADPSRNSSMMPERVKASAPTRIDLAGGTIDIWPLYLLHDSPITVNAAIDLMATAIIEAQAVPGIEMVSVDRGQRFSVDAAEQLPGAIETAPEELEFIVRLAAHFLSARSGAARRGIGGCRITTSCRAPAGSGLGGSSALGIALASALDRYVGGGLSPDQLLFVTRAIETQTLRIPTGEQDYHPALHGGPLTLHYGVEGTRIERLPIEPAAMQERAILIDTGMSRSSGLSNWDMLKRHLDGDQEVRGAMESVNRATHHLRAALLAGDLDAVGEALAAEWRSRKRLSPAVTDRVIDDLIEAGTGAGALAGKVCGAGGGGCVVLWAGAGRRQQVVRELASRGAQILEFRFRTAGVEITEP